jgi:hypothetical protein
LSSAFIKVCGQPIKEEYLLSGWNINEPYAILKIAGIKM